MKIALLPHDGMTRYIFIWFWRGTLLIKRIFVGFWKCIPNTLCHFLQARVEVPSSYAKFNFCCCGIFCGFGSLLLITHADLLMGVLYFNAKFLSIERFNNNVQYETYVSPHVLLNKRLVLFVNFKSYSFMLLRANLYDCWIFHKWSTNVLKDLEPLKSILNCVSSV